MSSKCPYCGQNATIQELGGLTERQVRLLCWLTAWDWSSKKSPTYSEICAASGFKSRSQVFHLLRALEERGFIRSQRRRARSIVLITATGDQNGTPAQESAAGSNVAAVIPTADEER